MIHQNFNESNDQLDSQRVTVVKFSETRMLEAMLHLDNTYYYCLYFVLLSATNLELSQLSYSNFQNHYLNFFQYAKN